MLNIYICVKLHIYSFTHLEFQEPTTGKTLTPVATKVENLHIVLASKSLAAVEASGDKDFFRLKKSLEKLIPLYDEINIDCPPNLGF